MSTSSHPWKQHLLRQADVLQQLRQPHRWTETSGVNLEEAVILGFYAIRKLINAFLLSDALIHRPIAMTAFPIRRQEGLVLGDEPLTQLYDLKTGRPVAHDLLFLCHQVMYNCVFTPDFDSARVVRRLYVTSDHQRKVALYAIELSALEDLFRAVAAER